MFRRTYEYAKLLMESYHPGLLTDADTYRAHFDWLKAEDESDRAIRETAIDLNSLMFMD